jgi:hypothetical protein
MSEQATPTKTKPDSLAKTEMREFLRKHNACSDGYEWAMANCESMADVWETARPDWLIWVATREGVLSDCDLCLFACWSVRQVWDLLTDERSRNAVEVAERFAKGEATKEELFAAWSAARSAESAAWSAWSAARFAESAESAARSAWSARSAAWSAWSAWSAARSAARSAQTAYIRAAYKNPFAKQEVEK